MFFILLATESDFRELYFKYCKYAGTVCLKTMKTYYTKYFAAEEMNDILQETFIKLYLYMGKTDEIKNIKSLIARITTLTTIKYMDNYAKSYEQNLVEAEELIDDSDETVFIDEDMESLVKIIKTLHPRYSSVLLLKNLHGFSLREISELGGIPYNTILTWHKRGKRQLAKKLQRLGYETEQLEPMQKKSPQISN